MSFVRGQHYLLKTKSGEVWVIYLENQTLLYKYFPPGRHYATSPATLVDLPVLEYSTVIDSSDNIHLVCITKSGELKYFVGKPGSAMNSTVLAEFDLKAQKLKHITLLLTAKRVHIFHLITSTVNSFIWAVMHSFWNGREWKDQQIGEIIAGKKVPPYTVDKDSRENIHLIFTSAHGGKFFEAQYKKFNKLYDLWSHTERINNLPENTPEVFSLVDRNDNLHLMTCGFSAVDNKVKICYCLRKEVSRNSSSWEPVITIHRPAQAAAWPLLSCRDNTIYGLWREQSGYMFSRSEDGGLSWSYPAPVNLAGKSALLSYNSNYPPDAGRIKIPLFPGMAGSTVNLALFEDYQVVPPFSPERSSLGGGSLPEVGRAAQEENYTAGKNSSGPEADLEVEDSLVREDIKTETANEIPAAVSNSGEAATNTQPGGAESVLKEKTEIEAQLEDLKIDSQLVCQAVEEIEGKLNNLEQGLVAVQQAIERIKEQQDEVRADEKITRLDSELQDVKNSQAGIERSVNDLTKKNKSAKDTLAELEKTRTVLSGEIAFLSTRVKDLQKTSETLAKQQDEAGQLIGKLSSYQKRIEGDIDKISITSGAIATVIERDIKEKIESLGKEMLDSRQRSEETAGQFNEEVKGLRDELLRLAEAQEEMQNNLVLSIQELRREFTTAQGASNGKLEEQLQEIIDGVRENASHMAFLEADQKAFQEKAAGLEKEQEYMQEELQRLKNRGFFERLFSG
ncbi:MAG: hypothetical protein M1130_04685 [Actinobacteria bacterium]|nr:hypothetical protein [Actinomycetota bacterium]